MSFFDISGTSWTFGLNTKGSVGTFANPTIGGDYLSFSNAQFPCLLESWYYADVMSVNPFAQAIASGPTKYGEFYTRVAQNSDGSSLFIGIKIVNDDAYCIALQEYEYAFTVLGTYAFLGEAIGDGWLYADVFYGSETEISVKCDYGTSRVYFSVPDFPANVYAKTDNGTYYYSTCKICFYGSSDQDTSVRVYDTDLINGFRTILPYRTPYSNSTCVCYIGTAYCSEILLYGGTILNDKVTGVHDITDRVKDVQDISIYTFYPMNTKGFAGESGFTISEQTYFTYFESLVPESNFDGTFEISNSRWGRIFAGKPDFTKTEYEYKNKLVKIKLQSDFNILAEKEFSLQNNFLLTPMALSGSGCLWLGSIFSIGDGTYRLHRPGHISSIFEVVPRMFCFSNNDRTGAVGRVGSILSVTDYEDHTRIYLTMEIEQPWMNLGASVFCSCPWPSSRKLSVYHTQPDHFVENILKYMGIGYDKSSTEWINWRNAVRQIPWSGHPRYYGGERCIDILNDLMTFLNTSYTLKADGNISLYTPLPQTTKTGTIDLSESYPDSFDITFTTPVNKVTVSSDYDPLTGKYGASQTFVFGTLAGGETKTFESPWFGNMAYAIVGAFRACRLDTYIRPVIHFALGPDKWGSFLGNTSVAITGLGSILPTSIWEDTGEIRMAFTSGNIMFINYLNETSQGDIYIVRDPGIRFAMWGSTVIDNARKEWY